MTWNYTKTWGCLALAALVGSLVWQNAGPAVVGALMVLPFVIVADVVSWFRHRNVTVLPPR